MNTFSELDASIVERSEKYSDEYRDWRFSKWLIDEKVRRFVIAFL